MPRCKLFQEIYEAVRLPSHNAAMMLFCSIKLLPALSIHVIAQQN